MGRKTSGAQAVLALRALIIGFGLALAACDSAPAPEVEAIDVGGEPYPTDFSLTDHHGKVRKLSEFRGKVVALFFGFTQCPDVCPTALATFAQMGRELGSEAGQVQVLFVTIDPERDTQQLLSEYVPAFDQRFLGLRGTPAETRRVADAFKVSYQKIPGKTANSYTMDHTAYIFLFDATGRLRLKVPHGQSPEALARLIHEIQDQ